MLNDEIEKEGAFWKEKLAWFTLYEVGDLISYVKMIIHTTTTMFQASQASIKYGTAIWLH